MAEFFNCLDFNNWIIKKTQVEMAEELNATPLNVKLSVITYWEIHSLNPIIYTSDKPMTVDDKNELFRYVLLHLIPYYKGGLRDGTIIVKYDLIKQEVATPVKSILTQCETLGAAKPSDIIEDADKRSTLVEEYESTMQFVNTEEGVESKEAADAIQAIVSMGMVKKVAEKVVNEIVKENPTLKAEEILKEYFTRRS